MKPKWLNARIARREDVTSDLFKLWLDLGEARQDFAFKAGQYCTIGLNDVWRPYSIVSAPNERYIELFIELVPPPDGNLTPLLYHVSPGDSLRFLSKAKGIFTLEPRFDNQVMVATVTGIAPFMSILRSRIGAAERGYKFFVLQGASYCDEFAYDKEFKDIELWTTLRMLYIPTVSRPQEARNQFWRGNTRRVNEIVAGYLEQWQLGPANTMIYACGHPGMVADVKKQFSPKGWKVKEERYWK